MKNKSVKHVIIPDHNFWDDDELVDEDRMLHDLFKKQKQLMDKLRVVPFIRMKDTEVDSSLAAALTNMLQNKTIATISNELEELREQLWWKHWKKYSQPIDLEETRLELIDILHFVLEGFMILGMGAEDVYRYYVSKWRENFERQRRGYNDSSAEADSERNS